MVKIWKAFVAEVGKRAQIVKRDNLREVEWSRKFETLEDGRFRIAEWECRQREKHADEMLQQISRIVVQ